MFSLLPFCPFTLKLRSALGPFVIVIGLVFRHALKVRSYFQIINLCMSIDRLANIDIYWSHITPSRFNEIYKVLVNCIDTQSISIKSVVWSHVRPIDLLINAKLFGLWGVLALKFTQNRMFDVSVIAIFLILVGSYHRLFEQKWYEIIDFSWNYYYLFTHSK